jgi:hypothetical protein
MLLFSIYLCVEFHIVQKYFPRNHSPDHNPPHSFFYIYKTFIKTVLALGNLEATVGPQGGGQILLCRL